MAIYGSQTTTTALAIAAVTKCGSKFTCPSDLGTVNAISAYCDRSASGTGYAVDCAIYADSSGAPGALVANSAIQISSNITRNAAGWYTGTYSGTKPVLTPGNVYWLVALFTKAGSTYYAAGASNQQASLADTLPFDDPFGASPTYAAKAMAIYVTYALLATTYTRTLSLDSYLKKILTKTPSLDAALTKADQTKTTGIDGYKQQTKYIYIGTP
jgi:hypothetical protein